MVSPGVVLVEISYSMIAVRLSSLVRSRGEGTHLTVFLSATSLYTAKKAFCLSSSVGMCMFQVDVLSQSVIYRGQRDKSK